MSHRVEFDEVARSRLSADAGRALAAGIEARGAFAPPNPAEWTPLSKPGLVGRERWRWKSGDVAEAAVLYFKRYRRTRWRDQWDRIWRQNPWHSRAWWEFRQAIELNEAEISAAPALACAETMGFVLESESTLCLGAAAGDALDRVLQQALAQNAPITRGGARHDLTQRLARFIAAFHQSGRCHRDLYLCHVFADLDFQARRPPLFTLIDLARVHKPWLRRGRWILKDLSQLDCSARQIGATRTDRARFLLAYLGLQPSSPRVRYYARRVAARSDAILRRIARKSRR